MVSFFQTLLLSWGASRSFIVTGLLLFIAFQLSFRPDYFSCPDYLTRPFPAYNPNPSASASGPFGFFINFFRGMFAFMKKVPDNACERSKHGSDLTFDFIIVGAGAAGSTIAYVLSQNPKWKVLLVEAGSDSVVESVVPQTFTYGQNNSRAWKFHAEFSNKSCQAYKIGCPMPCGKQLSGSTGTNAMLYVTGQKRDYDAWEALGNPGWGYDDLLPYFKMNERNQNENLDPAYHGFDGQLTVSDNVYVDAFKDVLRKGLNALGYKTLKDYNGGESNGYIELQSTIKHGERNSAYLAFIEPIKHRPNLFIVKNGLVTNILFNGTTAIGVNVRTKLSRCHEIQFKASKETIISAGGLGSPKILLQSGVGPKSDLENLGINVTLDLPGVGHNFQEHVYATHYIKINPTVKSQTLAFLFYSAFEYVAFRTGYLAHLSTVNANGFINVTDPNSTYSDIQLTLNRIDRGQLDFDVVLSDFGLKDEFIAPTVAANQLADTVQVYTILLNPEARGKVELRDKDPESKPKITTNFLDNDVDIKKMAQAVGKLRELVATEAFQNASAEFLKFDIDECNSIPYPSTEYDECYVQYFSAVLWHPVGTCKMGPANDTEAVVDANLRVYGISNLRVVDASVMPIIPSGNTQAPTYALARRAANLIKNTWS